MVQYRDMNKQLKSTSVGAVVLLCSMVQSAYAVSDAQIAAAKLCTQNVPFYERQYGIPSHLLSAISSTESGRWHKELKIVLPYPWAINAEGKAYYFDSKAQAVAGVKKLQAQGVRSIDIGCMQVNLVHHANAFSSIEQAFDPKSNIAYGASFLRNLYESEGSWRKATAAYHSKTPSRGSQYVGRVFRSWETIISRLRLSRDATVKQADASFDGRDMMPNERKTSIVRNNTTNTTTTAMLDTPTESKAPASKPIKMKVINVSNGSNNQRSNGIMVYKPTTLANADNNSLNTTAPITLAQADNAKTMPVPNAKIVHLGGSKTTSVKFTNLSEPTSSNLKTSSGPRFIFSD